MAETILNTRHIQKHDIEANWNKASNFIPKKGEIIVYDKEVLETGSSTELPAGRTVPYNYSRFKIGDGFTNVNQLEFADSEFTHRVTVPETPTGTSRYIAIHVSSESNYPRSFELQVREYYEFGRWLINGKDSHQYPTGVHTAIELCHTTPYFYLHPEVAISADYSSCTFYVYDQYGMSVDIGIKESELSADKITDFWVESVSELPSGVEFLPLTLQKPVEVNEYAELQAKANDLDDAVANRYTKTEVDALIPEIMQETGTSESAIMSQKATTEALQNITVSRENIPDFYYDLSATLEPDDTLANMKYLAVEVTYTGDSGDWIETPPYYDLFLDGGNDYKGHWTIVASAGHNGGEGALHSIYTHPGSISMHDKISGTANSCIFYIQFWNCDLGANVYVSNKGVTDFVITGVSISCCEELPSFEEWNEVASFFSAVDVDDYAELKSKANAAAPKSTVYTKDEVDELHSGIDNDILDLQTRTTNLEDNLNTAIAGCEIEGDHSLSYIAVTININENLPSSNYTHFVFDLVFGGDDTSRYGTENIFRLDGTNILGGDTRYSITKTVSGTEYDDGEFIEPIAYETNESSHILYFKSTKETVRTILCNGQLGYTYTGEDYITGISATYVESIPEAVSTDIHYTTVVEVAQETGNSEHKVMSQKAVTDELANKLTLKVQTDANYLYGTRPNGEADALFPASANSTSAYSVVMRDDAGRFKAVDPTENGHVATKGYVDGNFVPKTENTLAFPRAYCATANSSEVELITVNGEISDGSIARRGSNGTLKVGTPTAGNHAATKAYVDSACASSYTHVARIDIDQNYTGLQGSDAKWLKVTVGHSSTCPALLYKLYITGYRVESALLVNAEAASHSTEYGHSVTLLSDETTISLWDNIEVSTTNHTCSFYFTTGYLATNGCVVYLDEISGLGDYAFGSVTSLTAEFVSSLPTTYVPIMSILTPVEREVLGDVATKADIDQVWNDAMASFNYATGDGYQSPWGNDTYITVTTDVNGLATVKPTENARKAIDSSIIPIFDCVNENNLSPVVWLDIPSLIDNAEYYTAIAHREFYVADSSVACSHRLDVQLTNAAYYSSVVINRNGVDSSISIEKNGFISITGQDYYNSWILHFDVRIIKNKLYINVEEI